MIGSLSNRLIVSLAIVVALFTRRLANLIPRLQREEGLS